MKILKIMLAAILFVACVFLATANMHDVDLFFPNVAVAGWPELRQLRVPLFVVVLGALVAGVLVAGIGTLFEQLRLRAAERRARKERQRAESARGDVERERDAAVRERDVARTELLQARAESADLRQECDALRAEIRSVRLESPFEAKRDEPV